MQPSGMAELGPLQNTLLVFLFYAVPSLTMWAPIFAFAYSRRNFGGLTRNYTLAWLVTSLGTASILALMGLIQDLAS